MRLATIAVLTAVSTTALAAQDADRSVKDGGIKVPGWMGRIDRRPASKGKTINDSKFAATDGGFRISVGPAGNFWYPANTARGNYEVKATFKEHKMTADHPHSYGIFIGGADLESDNETLAYCIVYGTGTFAVKTFHGAKVTTVVEAVANDAVHKADATTGESTNEVGWRVQGDKASCVINGTEVKSFAKADLIGPDKLTSTDGVYGIRVTHNLELTVTGFGKK